MTEPQLIQRLKDGDQHAARTLYDAHVDRVFRICYRFAGEDHLAQDFTQETFVRAFTKIDTFRGESAFGTWLGSIATTVSLNGLRKVKRFRGRETVLHDDLRASGGGPGVEPDVKAKLHRAVDELPTGYRTVFLLHDLEGYTHEEIGTMLGIKAGTRHIEVTTLPGPQPPAGGARRPRGRMGMLKDQMGDMDNTGDTGHTADAGSAGGTGEMERFLAFLRREAADYHEPPAAPAEAMWAAVETRLAEDSLADVMDDEPFNAVGYHEPPAAPREAMWARIESAWVARRPVEQAAVETTAGPVRLAGVRTLRRRPRRTVIWLTGAAAASVALATALGRGERLPIPGEAEMVAATDAGPIAPPAAAGTSVPSLVEEPLETSRQFAAIPPPPAADPATRPGSAGAAPPLRAAVSLPSTQPAGPGPSRAQANDYDAYRHLDQAATLLVAFRTDIGSDESQRDLARWARELLVETRSRLATPAAEGQRERALLQDLELVLVQIARLGPDAPDFERELARESMEQQGTLMRLRSASGT
ncbi:RNA polymerase sigma factor [Candidatus Palauibacter sp.]|uniref:RNA polymerase sigma factor n=1 Tax=Candidatus Palauibacter sp. TaxID=3101350 RepID=UPI003CC61570